MKPETMIGNDVLNKSKLDVKMSANSFLTIMALCISSVFSVYKESKSFSNNTNKMLYATAEVQSHCSNKTINIIWNHTKHDRDKANSGL